MPFWAVNDEIADLHNEIGRYALATQQALMVSAVEPDKSLRLSDIAITMMAVDCLALHGAVRDSCAAGWAIVAPMLLRAELELLLGSLAIVNAGKRSEILAYKYHFAGTKRLLQLPGLPKEKRQRQRGGADDMLRHVPSEYHQEARDFVRKGKSDRFWYSPDFSGPKDIIDKHSNTGIEELYKHVSGGAHGGSLGIRSWRDIPDLEHPMPRRDPSAQSLAVAGSNIINLHMVRLRLAHVGVEEDVVFKKLFARNRSHEGIASSLFAEAMGKARAYVESRREDENRQTRVL